MRIEYYYNDEIVKTSLSIEPTETFEELKGLDMIKIKLFTDDSVFIGKATYKICEEETFLLFCYYSIKVEEQFRNQGYGTILVNLRQQVAKTLYPTLEQCVHCNQYSIGMYRKLGFIEKEAYTILTKK